MRHFYNTLKITLPIWSHLLYVYWTTNIVVHGAIRGTKEMWPMVLVIWVLESWVLKSRKCTQTMESYQGPVIEGLKVGKVRQSIEKIHRIKSYCEIISSCLFLNYGYKMLLEPQTLSQFVEKFKELIFILTKSNCENNNIQ